jgi:hypothetical protein
MGIRNNIEKILSILKKWLTQEWWNFIIINNLTN